MGRSMSRCPRFVSSEEDEVGYTTQMSRRLQFALMVFAGIALICAEFRVLGGTIDDLKAFLIFAIMATACATLCASGLALLCGFRALISRVACLLSGNSRLRRGKDACSYLVEKSGK